MYGQNYKVVSCKGTLDSAVSDAFSEAESLRDEMEEWKDSLEGTNFERSDKFERISEAYETLNDNCESPDVSDWLGAFEVEWAEGRKKSIKRRGPSRAARLGNAVQALNAAIDVLREIEEDEELPQDKRDEARELANDIEGKKDELDGVEFPGMFG